MKIKTICWVLFVLCCISIIGCAYQKAGVLKSEAVRESNLDKWTEGDKIALENYLRAEKIAPLDADSLRRAGRLFWLKGQYDNAERYLLKALEKDSQVENGWNNIGWVYESKLDYPKMINAFLKANEITPEVKWNKTGLALAHHRMKDFDTAEKLYKEILQEHPEDKIKDKILYSLISLYKTQKDFTSAEKFIERYIDLHSSNRKLFHAYAGLGRLHYLRNEFQKAEEYLSKTLSPTYLKEFEFDEKITNSWLTLGWLYWKQSQYEKMQLAFQSGLKLAQKYGHESSIIYGKIGLGAANFYMNNYKVAEDLLYNVAKYDLSDQQKEELNSFHISLALEQNNIGLAKKLWTKFPYLGIYSIFFKDGIEVKFLQKNHFGDIGGLKAGDKIISINGETLSDFGSFSRMVDSFNYGDVIDFYVIRNKEAFTKRIVLDYGFPELARKHGNKGFDWLSQYISSNEKSQNLFGEYHALIIAVNKYDNHSSNLSNLEHSILEASQLKELLIKKYSFKEKNLIFLKDATREQIISAFDSYVNEAQFTSDDNLLIFYSGHGFYDETLKEGFWLPRDSHRKKRSNWISNSLICSYIDGIKTQHSLVISDACFSGSLVTKTIMQKISDSTKEAYKLPSRKAMTSTANERASEPSIFMEFFLKELNKNTKKYLSAVSLYSAINELVTNHSKLKQKPLYNSIYGTGDKGGDFIFVQR